MKVRFTQIIDYWVGVPLCALLSVWALLVRLVFRAAPRAPRRILFIELSEMGSAVLAHSSLVRAKEISDGGALYFLIFEKNYESVALLDVLPAENILIIKEDSFWHFVASTFATLVRIRRLRIDTVIDLELFSRFTALISYMTGASNRVGFHNYTSEGLFRGTFLTHPVLYNHHQHMALNFLALVLALQAPRGQMPLLKQDVRGAVLPPPRYPSSESEKRRVWELLTREKRELTPDTPLIVFNPDPGPALPIRGWPIENFAALAKALLERAPSATIVVMGLPASRPLAQTIIGTAGAARCIDLTGKTASLRDVVALFGLSRVLVTADGGPAHMASLTDIRCVVLFGPETPRLYAPLGDNVTTLYAHLSCSPCFAAANHRRTICTDNKCMQAIEVRQVLDTVLEGMPRAGAEDGTRRPA
jgi:ADP-heptose:LPS heptosyltransferase